MADNEVKIVISGNNEAAVKALKQTSEQIETMSSKTKSGNGTLFKSFTDLKMGFDAVVGGVKMAADIIGKFTNAAIETENVQMRLAQALANQGKFSTEVMNTYNAQAAALQKITTFGDDQINMLQSQLTMYGVSKDQMLDLTKATLDFAQAKGIDLKTAGDMIGKSISTETNALARHGIQLDKNMSATEKATKIQEGFNSMFGGQAQAAANTFGGQLKQLQNIFGDFMEEIGFGLINGLQPFIEELKKIAQSEESMRKVQQVATSIGAAFALVGSIIKMVFGMLGNSISHAVQLVSTLGNVIDLTLNRKFKEAAEEVKKIPGIYKEMVLQEIDIVKTGTTEIVTNSKKLMDTMTKDWSSHYRSVGLSAKQSAAIQNQSTDSVATNETKSYKDRLTAYEEYGVKFIEITDTMKSATQAFTNSFASSFVDMIMGTKKNFLASLADMIQAFATMIAKQMAMNAIAMGLAGNWIKAAQYTAGAVAVAGIGSMIARSIRADAGVKEMATGGIIDEPVSGVGERTGQRYRIGERGPESIVPINNIGSMGGVSIGNITVVSNNARDFMRQLANVSKRAGAAAF